MVAMPHAFYFAAVSPAVAANCRGVDRTCGRDSLGKPTIEINRIPRSGSLFWGAFTMAVAIICQVGATLERCVRKEMISNYVALLDAFGLLTRHELIRDTTIPPTKIAFPKEASVIICVFQVALGNKKRSKHLKYLSQPETASPRCKTRRARQHGSPRTDLWAFSGSLGK